MGILTFMGKNIEEMTKEELIEALKIANDMINERDRTIYDSRKNLFSLYRSVNKIDKIYRHYKGGLYKYITDAMLEWDIDCHVIIYESLQDGRRWVRPRVEFFGYVMDGDKMVLRFELLEKENDTSRQRD